MTTMRNVRCSAAGALALVAVLAACAAEEPVKADSSELSGAAPHGGRPTLRDFIAGNATWVLETPDVGLPVGESDTIVLVDGSLRSYLHASTRSAGIRDSNGDPVEFPGCVTTWDSTDNGRSFHLTSPTCLFPCAGGACTFADHTNQQQYPRVAVAADGTIYMAYEWAAGVHLRESHDGGVNWSAEESIGSMGFRTGACRAEERVGACNGNEETEGQCLAGAPPGIFVEGDELFVFADVGSCPAHMGCWRGDRHAGAAGLRPCDHGTIFSSTEASQGVGVLGAIANRHFDFRFISSADVVKDGDLYIMAYEGERGPPTHAHPDEWGLGFAFSPTLDARWTTIDRNPVLMNVPGNVGFGHADLVKLGSEWIMFDTVAEPTQASGAPPSDRRGRWRLVWLNETVTNGRTSHVHGTVSIDGAPAEGLVVTAEGDGEIHRTVSRSDGVYAFDKLHPSATYTFIVNDETVRRDVVLTAGEDGWHSEDFALVSSR